MIVGSWLLILAAWGYCFLSVSDPATPHLVALGLIAFCSVCTLVVAYVTVRSME